MKKQSIPNRTRIRAAALLTLVLLLSFTFAQADAGMNDGETILDNSNSFKNTAYNAAIEAGNFFITGNINAIKAFSTLTDSFSAQFQNKEQGLNQNTEIDVAKQNLDNSKDNVATMFFFIVATFTILFDMIVSLIYISLLMLFIWIIFVGYAKFLIMIIDFISGKLEERGIRK